MAEKIVESELVTSFVFTAKDERAVLAYLPGQYIGLQVRPTHSEYNEIRQYSLSQASNGKNYRISVKREQSPFVGVVSNYLHDEVNLGDEVSLYPPAGDFLLARPCISCGINFSRSRDYPYVCHARNISQARLWL